MPLEVVLDRLFAKRNASLIHRCYRASQSDSSQDSVSTSKMSVSCRIVTAHQISVTKGAMAGRALNPTESQYPHTNWQALSSR